MKERLIHRVIRPIPLLVSLILANGFLQKKADSVKFCGHNDSIVQLIDNGYESIGVWISDDVPQDFGLIPLFEDLILKFSSALYKLTRKRAYVREVQILIPHSWEPPENFTRKISSHSSNLESESQAQIWIRNSSPRNGTSGKSWKIGDREASVVQPYVIKTTPCGFPGSHIRMSSEFIRFGGEDAVIEKIGFPEKVLVKEWAKLRWGVYDEIPRVNDPSSYYLRSNLAVHPTMCSSVIPGEHIIEKTSERNCNPKTSLYDRTCRFEPSKEAQNKTFGSLLYRANLPYIQDFCDDSEFTTPEKAHDVEAPTSHNLHCKGRSVWEIMRQHPDFVDRNNSPRAEDVPPSTKFHFVQHENERIVLVLDISSSMREHGKLKMMRQAVSHFIDTVPENGYIGIVCFARRAYIKKNLLQVRHNDERNDLKKALVGVTKKGTSIGSGILKGIKVLNESGPPHLRGKGGSIIILTDGDEHHRPKINETIAQVKASGVTVNTIALGANIARELESLAVVSGGRSHAASFGEYGISTELQEAFSSHHEHVEGGPISLLSEEINVAVNFSVETDFVIDESIGKNTRITIFYSEPEIPLIILTSPSEKISTRDHLQPEVTMQRVREFKTVYIRISGVAEPGNWKVTLTNTSPKQKMAARINVISYQLNSEPLLISPALLCRSVDFTKEEAMVVYASLSKGELAVLSAFVFAEITRPLTSNGVVDNKKIFLRDDGLDPDVTSHDGVYSAYFTSFTIMGRYNVKIFASDNNGQATVDTEYILGLGNFQTPSVEVDTRDFLKNRLKRNTVTSQRKRFVGFKLPPFQRVSSAGGAFLVQNFTAENNCNNGYNYFQDSCYKVIASPLTWEKSQTLCKRQGGYVSQVNSLQEFTWHVRIADVSNSSSASAWIGGTDEALQLQSGNNKTSCTWLYQGSVNSSEGTSCGMPRKVVCEKPIRDRFPPSRIVDLKGRFDPKTKLLNLTWSAPGDDFNVGRAMRYEIRTLRTRRAVQTLTSDFSKGEQLNISNQAIEHEMPAEAGSTENVVVDMTDNLACPPHAVLDILLALPLDRLGSADGSSARKKLIIQFINNILEQFDINEYEIAVAAFSLAPTFEPVFHFSEDLDQTQIQQRLAKFAITTTKERTINEAVESMFKNGGRNGVAKVLLVVTDDQGKLLSDIVTDSFNITKIVVSTSNDVDKFVLWEVVSSPPCLNSFVIEKEELLDTITTRVARQLCQARANEFQVVGIKAYDDLEQGGDLSNVFPFVVEHTAELYTCDELSAQSPMVAGITVTTIILSVGIPFAAIFGVLGSVIIVGQVKKHRKKRLEKKKKEEKEKLEEMQKSSRRTAVRSKASEHKPSLDSTPPGSKNPTSSGKIKKIFRNRRTTPIVSPLV